eukprot:8733016-Pyramimonas_sp.AAC.1
MRGYCAAPCLENAAKLPCRAKPCPRAVPCLASRMHNTLPCEPVLRSHALPRSVAPKKNT